jgi:hypothetical protein
LVVIINIFKERKVIAMNILKTKILKTVIFPAALMFGSLAANADTYDFSYTFNDSQVVTGSLSGTLVGQFIDNISNIQVSLNGTQFSGSLYSAAWNPVTLNWDSTPAVVSTNAALNNFIFADSNVAGGDLGASNYFMFTNDPTYGSVAFAVNTNNGMVALDGTSYGAPATNAANWSLTEVAAPVPEPQSYAMLLAGLGFISVAAVRRRQG